MLEGEKAQNAWLQETGQTRPGKQGKRFAFTKKQNQCKNMRKLRDIPSPSLILIDGQECLSIPLVNGMVAIVDKCDSYLVLGSRWYALRGDRTGTLWYADSSVKIGKKTQHRLMHRIILGITNNSVKGEHKNGNGLDNRRCNLRPATHSQNLGNRKKNVKGSSRFKGVNWHTFHKKWWAHIGINKHQKHLGYFDSEIEAAKAYNFAAVNHWGEFARLNTIPEPSISEQQTNSETQKETKCQT